MTDECKKTPSPGKETLKKTDSRFTLVPIMRMEEPCDKDKAYMEVLLKLRRLIAAEYRQGGRLPPSREMCERFGVCLPTYGKAIERLRIDGSVYRNSNKGIFVSPYSERLHKIGLVIGDGRESPFLEFQDTIAALLLALKRHRLHAQLIQAGNPALLQRKALFYGVDALLWHIGATTAAPAIERILRERPFPLLLMNSRDPAKESAVRLFRCQCVHYDYAYTGRKRAEILLSRGHREIACTGSAWFAEYTQFASAIRESGAHFHMEQPLSTETQIRRNLAPLIRQHRITGLYSEGGLHPMRAVFETLSTLPEKERPELLVTDFEKVPDLIRQYPAVRCIGRCAHRIETVPETAVKMLHDHLESGTPLRSVALRAFVFRP